MFTEIKPDVLKQEWVVGQDVKLRPDYDLTLRRILDLSDRRPHLPENVSVAMDRPAFLSAAAWQPTDLHNGAASVMPQYHKYKGLVRLDAVDKSRPGFKALINEAMKLNGRKEPAPSAAKGKYEMWREDPKRLVTIGTADMIHLYAETWVGDEYKRLPFDIGAKIERDFRVAVECSVLNEVVNLLADERIDLKYEAKEGRLIIRCGASTTRLVAYAAPLLPAEPVPTFTPKQQKEIKWVKLAAATEDKRPTLRWLHVGEQDGQKQLVASNDFVLHCADDSPDVESRALWCEGLPQWIDPTTKHELGQSDPAMRFSDYGYILRGFDKSQYETVTLYTADLVKALKRLKGMAKDSAMSVRFALGAGMLCVRGISAERGETNETLRCAPLPQYHEFAANVTYLLNALSGMGEQTEMTVGDKGDPLRLVSGTHTAVIMPMSTER